MLTFTDRTSYIAAVADYKAAITDLEAKIRQAKKEMREHDHPRQRIAQSERQYLRGKATALYAERVESKLRAGQLRAAAIAARPPRAAVQHVTA